MSVAVNSSNSQTLPPREASLFKKILKHFKDKQFKSGLKVSNQILANPKYAEHGETLSMKGLILNSMGKRAEAFEYVKRGLKNDVRSHVCWHVFGLLQKADHKYEEAIKCYRNALRLKKDSVQILSDLSLVQIQTRDLEGYRDSRYQLFLLRPGERSTWIGCAMAYHLTGDHATAVNILGEYQKTNASTGVRKNSNSSGSRRNNEAYEQSELLLYNVSILLESRRFDEALSLLISNQADIVDKVAYYELTTEIYLALNKFADAQKIVVEELISRNAENANYCRLLERSVRLAAAGKQQQQGQGHVNKRSGDEGSGGDFGDELQRLELYEKLAAQYPRSQTIARLPLNFITDLTAFTRKIDAYLRRGFRKGQPAMFRDLKHLYNSELVASRCLESFTCELRAGQASVEALNSCLLTVAVKTAADSSTPFSPKTISRPELETHLAASRRGRPPLPPKIAAIEALLLDYADNLKAHGSFEAPVAAAGNDTEKEEEGEEEEAITCLLWVYYFLAQHFDALKEFSLALHFANAALLHTPTLIDVFVIKAKIFKHAGFPEKAARYLEEAASLDTSDRYLNCKAAKYLIRINKLKEAEEMCVKFTREGVPAVENLNEMQCMWFLTEMAAAYQRMGMLGEAMKKCIEVDNHFAEINEDQFDFNTYCMLKVTLRAYVQMIRLEDHLKSHRFFLTAARAAIEIYLRLHDKPVSNKEEEGDSANSQMSASELRKMRNKQRKAQLKAEKENAEKAGAKKGGEKRDAESKSEFAEVVDVAKLEKTETPLDDVMRFLAPYKLFGRHLLEAHFLAFEVYARKGKLLLQLQSLKRAFRLMESEETGAQEQGGQKKVVTQKHQQHHQPRLYRQCALFLSALLTRRDSGTMPEAMRHVLNEQLGQQVSSLGSLLFGGGPGQQNKTGAGGDQQKQTDLLSQLPSTAEFLQRTLPHRSPSFTVRVERIKAEHYLATVAEEAAENANQSNSTTNTAAAPVPVVKAKQLKAASQFTEEMIGELVKDAEAGSLSQLTLEGALALYGAVKSAAYGQLSAPRLEALRQTLHRLYPLASRFMLEKELAELEVELRDADYFTADTEEGGGGGSGGGQGKETTEKALNPVTTNHCES